MYESAEFLKPDTLTKTRDGYKGFQSQMMIKIIFIFMLIRFLLKKNIALE